MAEKIQKSRVPGNSLKNTAERNNPCLKESQMSIKCLDENGYNKKLCEQYFENYRICKKFWSWIQNQRKLQGIEPSLPAPDEREEVKQKYLPLLKRKSL